MGLEGSLSLGTKAVSRGNPTWLCRHLQSATVLQVFLGL